MLPLVKHQLGRGGESGPRKRDAKGCKDHTTLDAITHGEMTKGRPLNAGGKDQEPVMDGVWFSVSVQPAKLQRCR